MKTMKSGSGATLLLLAAGIAVAGCNAESSATESVGTSEAPATRAASSHTFPVSATGVHYFSTAIIHSREPTTNGRIQRSTDIIKLSGDIEGYILYHPTSTFDTANNTLVNTGTQIFSGTILGSEPVLLHDDRFRFEADLATGAVTGEVFLGRSKDAPNEGGWFECHLTVVGTGVTPEGDSLAEATGQCTRYGNVK